MSLIAINKQRHRMPKWQSGFSLLEILVTVIILSIGLLGLAGLQATALKYSSTSYQRTQATALAYQIVDEMRANQKAARCGAYTSGASRAQEDCTSAAVSDLSARTDLGKTYFDRWQNTLINTLPDGQGSVTYEGILVNVLVTWDDSRGDNGRQEFRVRTEI